MKIVSLNIWGGKMLEKLLVFIHFASKRRDVDIFCFQEVLSNPFLVGRDKVSQEELRYRVFSEIAYILPEYTGFMSISSDSTELVSGIPAEDNERSLGSYGNAIFIRKSLNVDATGDYFVYGNRNSKAMGLTERSPRALQYAVVSDKLNRYAIFNLHGLWNGGLKKDSPERLDQSHKVSDFMKRFSCRKIVCGDFNLDPETESIKILEGNGEMINLIKECRIKTTRNPLYRHFADGSPYADYFLVSPDISVRSFYVQRDNIAEVSDHSPLFLDCD